MFIASCFHNTIIVWGLQAAFHFCAKRSRVKPHLVTHPSTKFWLSRDRASTRLHARPSAPQANQCDLPHFLASVIACNLILRIHVVANWQLSKQGIHWSVSHDRIVGSVVDPSWLRVFPNLSADKLLVLNWSQAHFLQWLQNDSLK